MQCLIRLLLLFLWLQPSPLAAQSIAIVDVTVIDVLTGEARPQQTVLIEGERIQRIANSAGVRLSADTQRVDGSGKFLLPGLFDAHVHLIHPDTQLPLLIARGVTCVRDTGAETETILALRKTLAQRDRVGPRLVATGAIVDGDPPFWPFSIACSTPAKGRAAVRELQQAGVDQIKVYSKLRPEVWQAVLDEASQLNLTTTGHVPFGSTVLEAAKLGQGCIEHLEGFGPLIAQLLGDEIPGAGVQDDQQRMLKAFEAFDYWPRLGEVQEKDLDEMVQAIARSGLHLCPTLVVMEGAAQLVDEDATPSPDLELTPPFMRAFWKMGGYESLGRASARALPEMVHLLGVLQRAGVPLMIGTDLANPNVFPGSSVHREMQLFQESGIEPAAILRSATIVPARFMGLEDRLGSIEPGKDASLLLLEANPLEDVMHASHIAAVFERGTLYDASAIADLEAQARDLVAAMQGKPFPKAPEIDAAPGAQEDD